MNKRLFVDIHVIETLPPSCVNRDDLGSPKTAFYGGVTRARVSSQAWKRAIRREFQEMNEDIGARTKHICDLVTKEIVRLAPDLEKPEALAKKAIESVGIAFDPKKEQDTKVLIFISREQAKALAELALEHRDEKKFDKKVFEPALKDHPSIDIALFGRMLAENPDLSFDAAAQVAHAISTHEVHNEYDYFTAVDDCKDEAGAAHLDTTEFNSSTMYRYAAVNALELERHLKEQTPHAVRAFAEAFIRSMPTGKQNTFANRVRPDAVYVAVRRDQPVNMAAAFEKPVQAGKEGYAEKSVACLAAYAEETYRDYFARPELELTIGMKDLGQQVTLPKLLDDLEAHLAACLAEEAKK